MLFGSSGFEAVEAALKTARLATGRRGIVAFEGGYHGLGYGALNATHRGHFRTPFLDQLGRFGRFVEYPEGSGEVGGGLERLERELRRLLRRREVGAILVEPVQARGGIRIPPGGFLRLLRGLCDEYGALLVVDEVYTGFGRTGRWFGVEHSGVVPDLVCLGKALTGGFPLSACVGRAEVMDAAWPPSAGEAIHTSTYLGHPVGCAMALAQLGEIGRLGLVRRAAVMGRWLVGALREAVVGVGGEGRWRVRGAGLMVGMECRLSGGGAGVEVWRMVKRMLAAGVVVLPEGQRGEVLGFTPPLTVSRRQLEIAVRVVRRALGERGEGGGRAL